MGGNNNNNRRQQKSSTSSSSFSILKLFKCRRPSRADDGLNNIPSPRKVQPQDDDDWPLHAVADPRIDSKASAFIANFYATRFSESERQICQAGKASSINISNF